MTHVIIYCRNTADHQDESRILLFQLRKPAAMGDNPCRCSLIHVPSSERAVPPLASWARVADRSAPDCGYGYGSN